MSFAGERRARNRAATSRQRRKRTKAERAAMQVELERDKALMDTIREIFGMAPLYAPDPLAQLTDEERFGNRVYSVSRTSSGVHYELGP